ncbi:hypothetical protein NDU88_002059 [Pleurodeles waltl]|uniref:Uncharacterized protein n=1 Tax=Pleurodeles waltl TaxID=8319 RepID=A0AAV7NKY6_PLEWA|nr:hypothetical protein NDU88_002059 [Pleurodeles waltl]
MEAVLTKMAEGQRKQERIMERFLEATTEDRETMKKAILGQAKKMDTVAQAQETSMRRLADLLGQRCGHIALPSVVLQKYTEGEEPDFFFLESGLLVRAGAETDRFPSTQSTQLLEQEVKENRCQEGSDMKTTTVTKDFCLQERRPGSDAPNNKFHWIHPEDQLEGGRNTDVKGREKIECGEAKEQRQHKGENEQRESRYIEKQEQQRRGVSDTGCKNCLGFKQMQRNPMEEADQEDTDRREEEEEEDKT